MQKFFYPEELSSLGSVLLSKYDNVDSYQRNGLLKKYIYIVLSSKIENLLEKITRVKVTTK